MSDLAILRRTRLAGHADPVDEEMGISRDEVREIFGALADIKAGVFDILGYIEGNNGEEEEEEDLGDT